MIRNHEPGSVVVSLVADQAVRNQEELIRSIRLGSEAARRGWVTCVGLPISPPDTGRELARLRPGLLNLGGRLLAGRERYDYERLSSFLDEATYQFHERNLLERASQVAVVPTN